MKIEDFARQIDPEEVLSGDELEDYQQHMKVYLSEHSTKEQLIDKAKALYMADRYKAKIIDLLGEKIRTLETELVELRAAATPPVVDRDVCQCCGKVLEQATGGRKKKYCSESCKQKKKRQRTQ